MVLIRLRKVALTVAARCSGVAPSIGVFKMAIGDSIRRSTGNAGTPWDDQQAMLRLYAPVDGFRHLLRAVLALMQEILTQEINNAYVSSVSDSVCVIPSFCENNYEYNS